ncbi:MAG: bifunctional precorrin-2 dehydrogenase/sirohydrochlorin ferrochelatase [Desulfotignum sp.]|nr:bifunctional precorrin-2 dehydrogenase/sirohydrochlorin ferrochelatase [Desulfotignum sp.]
MKYYPVFLNIKDRQCLVVGGGRVGARKAAVLVSAGAVVTVISQNFCRRLADMPDIQKKQKMFHQQDLENMFLVFAATSDADLNHLILAQARAARVLCSSADAPDQGDFILPAVMNQGDLIFAVSTCGASPALAKKLCRDLVGMYGPEYATFLILMKAVRNKLLASGHDPDGHKKIFRAMMEKNLPALLAAGDITAVDTILFELLGSGFVFDDLISQKL